MHVRVLVRVDMLKMLMCWHTLECARVYISKGEITVLELD